jgi:hypothetical protein
MAPTFYMGIRKRIIALIFNFISSPIPFQLAKYNNDGEQGDFESD